MTNTNQSKIKREKTKWYMLSFALFILIGAWLFANPVQATEQWSQYGKPVPVSSGELGGFINPGGVAVDNSGNVYVADTNNNRIQKLTASTGVWSQWGGQHGSDVGQFANPRGVAVDSSGNVYVADTNNHRIQKLSVDTGVWSQWGSQYGSGLGQFAYPNGVAVDKSGNVYVADTYNNRIQKLSVDTGLWSQWGSETFKTGSDLGQFAYPRGVAVDSSGNVYVADTDNHRIQKLTATTWSQWGGQNGDGDELGEFSSPTGVAVDSSGNVYVADRDNNRIQKLTAATWSQLGGENGSELGQFAYPTGVAVDSGGNVYVSDFNNNRIQKLTAATGGWKQWATMGMGAGTAPKEFHSPRGVAVDSSGNVYVADTNNHRIQKLTVSTGAWSQWGGQDGSGLGEFSSPTGVAVDSSGNVYVADTNNNRIQKLTASTEGWSQLDGENSSDLGQFTAPSGVAVDSSGNVYVADTYNHRIQKLTASTGHWSQLGGQYGNDLGQFSSPTGVAVDSSGNVYVSDNDNNRIQKLPASTGHWSQLGGKDGNDLGQFIYPTGVAVDSSGNVYVSDSDNDRIQKLTASTGGWSQWGGGQYGSDLGQFASPTGVAVDSNGNLYVADTNNHRIQKLVTTVVPNAPTGVMAMAGDQQAAISFTAPAYNGGSAITSYTVTANPGGKTGTGTTSPITVTGLTNGTTYSFTVIATNIDGNSAASSEVSVTPQLPIPGVPLLATPVAGNAQVALTWNPVNGSTGYRVYQSVNSATYGTEVTTVSGSVYSYNVTDSVYRSTVTGLANGTTYYFVVKAINAGGDSAASNQVSATPIAPSEPPSSGGGGGGSTGSMSPIISTDGTLTLPVGRSGEVSLQKEVTVSIPTGATAKELKITIEKLVNTQNLITDKHVLASPIFEILKNFSENFSKPVTLTFVFDKTKLSGNQTAAVYYFDEAKKEWVEVSGGKINENYITVQVDHFTKYAVFAVGQAATVPTPDTKPTINFSDISGHWAEAIIKQAVSRGIVGGYPDGTFKPGKTVTRAEFTVMLMNTLKPQGAGAALTFTDKAKIGSWAQTAVEQAVQAGMIKGYEDGTFRPDAVITRAEMAVMIGGALGQSTAANASTDFADDKDIPAWAKASVSYVKQAGIVQGKSDNHFAPEDHATRAEAVTVLMNVLAQKSK
ncbi:hypothetical protein BC351_36505 [Paenibacillus ferrarius]|uniref:Uncharacterized protein n=1 Tax=Paenibacillus ferrarius TaxID=1469647 RepID=A0A1V4HCD9_9BACL|nr:S-layer homology domain-containing protein [Paenibacillus ferrarius]OPH50000.1 hypothetical protein BC351_36505 [Paenibacillus ferrarius]